MRKLSFFILVSGLAVVAGACSSPDYKPDPSVEACTAGGPLTARQRMYAAAPNPQAVYGMPVGCQMGRDGIMRLSPN